MKKIFTLLLIACCVSGCASTDISPKPQKSPPPGNASNDPSVLRIGTTANYPPMIFLRDGKLAGLEFDLMTDLGRELGRTITIVSMPWDELFSALMAGRVDIIMSGISITRARETKIDFTEPWMKSGLMAMTDISDGDKFTSKEDILNLNGRIAAVANTTAQAFVRKSCKYARFIKVLSANDGATALVRNTADLFVDDIPSIAWQLFTHEGEVAPVKILLNEEDIAWGIRRGDTELKDQVNQVIAKWTADGSLDKQISKWVPYYDEILKRR